MLGVSRQYFAQIEKGTRGRRMSVELLLKIANALNLPSETAIALESSYESSYDTSTRKRTGRKPYLV